MKKLLKGAISTLLIGLMCAQMLGMSALAKEFPSFKLPVTVEQYGEVPDKPEKMDIVLTAVDGTCPMPEGSVDGKYTIEVTADTTGYFPEITFPKLGIYEYTVHQERGGISRCDYDNTVYNMRVYITNAEDGDGFESTTILYINDVNTKYAEIVFENEYAERNTRTPDPSSPTNPTTPTNPTEPTVPTTVPSEPTGGSNTPVDNIDDQDIFGVLGQFDEFGNPIGLLPATGTLWWAVPILVLGGVLLMIIGRRRNRGSENNE